MKKIMIAVMVSCAFIALSGITAYCQDSSDDRDIEQSESQIGQNLDSEIGSEQAQAESEVGQVDSSMSISGN